MAGQIEELAKNELMVLTRAAGIKRRIKIGLYDWYNFQRLCQGGIPLSYQIKGTEYENNDLSFLAEYHELPEAVVILSQVGLGTAVHTLNDIRKAERIADEMTDPLCQKAYCKNGADCILKRLKKK